MNGPDTRCMKKKRNLKIFSYLVLFPAIFAGCAKVPTQEEIDGSSSAASGSNNKYLYISSGRCYSGNNTTFTNATSSNLIYRLNMNSGSVDLTIADYFSSPSNAGDSPASIVNADTNYIYALIENTTTASLRRIEKIEKKEHGTRYIFSNNTTALSAQLRDLLKLDNGDLLVSKSTALEYLTSANARFGAPFISASAAPCNTSTTLISKILTLSNGKFVFLHAATGQNRFGIFASNGGTTCLAGQAAPNAASFPSAAFYDAANSQLLVAYAGNAVTTDLNSIYAYPIDETTNAIGTPQKVYDAALFPATYGHLLYGISEMTYDPSSGIVYIATAINTATTAANYAIERFNYDPTQLGVDNTKVLRRIGNAPFFSFGSDTKCISSMFIAD